MKTQYEIIQETLLHRSMTWLITGIAGFIGSNLLEKLLKMNQQVIGLDNFLTGHMSNLEEVKARRGPVIAIACEGDDKIAELADDVIFVPDVDEYLQPLVTSIPLQLLAYQIAILRGCNVDRPRNLAKSVTVE